MLNPNPEEYFLVEPYPQGIIIHLPSRLTVLEAVSFKHTFHNILQSNYPHKKIILDWEETRFIDSSGIGALISNLKLAKNNNVKLILRHINPQIMSVFSLTGLNNILYIESEYSSDSIYNAQIEKHHLPHTHPSVKSGIKRFIDIIGALVGLIITAIVFIPIAIAIKIESPGPVLFSQMRCGWLGKKFRLWKFRSLCINAEAMKANISNQVQGALFKNDNDPRITKVGKFLRRTSLDELPQFWNVLLGEMSLVGTRPPTVDEVELYEIPEWQRLDVKPGITGEWQVYGRSNIRNFEDVIRLDLRYQHNWSLFYDLKLISTTIIVLFSKNNGAV
ncbi:MAG TPA: sugar transferase [Allocoleopsis sp.]